MFRLIVAGGRDFNNYPALASSLDRLLKNVCDDIQIVCGMARGADRLGERYAKEHDYRIRYFPADWDSDGRSAGFRRNVRMAENADALVAFWDGRKMINEQYERAKRILTEHAEGHAQLAQLLVDREVIFAEDVEKIFGPRPWQSRADELLEAQMRADAERMAAERTRELEAKGEQEGQGEAEENKQ